MELKTAECCAGAPPVLEFDPNGNLVQSWGGPGQGYEWPQSNHGIFVDHKGNVWIGGNGAGDSHILKFTRNGKFIAQYGKAGVHRGPHERRGIVDLRRRQQRPAELRPRREDRRRPARQRGVHRRRVSEQARCGARCGYAAR